MADADKGGCCLLITVCGIVLVIVCLAGMVVGFFIGMAGRN